VAGLLATTEGYHVQRRDTEDAPTTWIARQTLRLETGDRDILLAEVGALQAQGLLTRSLGSTLSEAAHEAERTALIEAAIEGLRAQATTVANSLGLDFRGFAELQVDGARPMPMPRAMMMDAAANAPVMTEGRSEVSVTITATALLAP
jgi:uncharacterized protein YggE